MFGSTMLDVAIGVIFVFILVSVICSAVREGIESILKSRAAHLEHGIRELLNDRAGTDLARDLFNHPLIAALYENDYDTSRRVRDGKKRPWGLARGGGLPSYIPSRHFATALMDLAVRGREITPENSSGGAPVISLQSLRESVSNLGNERVQRALLVAIDSAQGDLNRAQANIEAWYDGSMDRVSGGYKRSTHNILLVIGLLTAIIMNVDALAIADHLYRNDADREVLVARAISAMRADSAREAAAAAKDTAPATPPSTSPAAPQAPPAANPAVSQSAVPTANSMAASLIQSPAPASATPAKDTTRSDSTVQPDTSEYGRARAALDSLPIPLGWGKNGPQPPYTCTEWVSGCAGKWVAWTIVTSLLGWVITALAASLGAPFWFDVLNKVMVIRSTVKPHEKSKEEGSEDRRDPPRPVVAAAAPPVGSGGAQTVPSGAGAVSAPALVGAAAGAGVGTNAASDDVDACGGEVDVLTTDEDLPPANGGVE